MGSYGSSLGLWFAGFMIQEKLGISILAYVINAYRMHVESQVIEGTYKELQLPPYGPSLQD